jgi:hypothetical protein
MRCFLFTCSGTAGVRRADGRAWQCRRMVAIRTVRQQQHVAQTLMCFAGHAGLQVSATNPAEHMNSRIEEADSRKPTRLISGKCCGFMAVHSPPRLRAELYMANLWYFLHPIITTHLQFKGILIIKDHLQNSSASTSTYLEPVLRRRGNKKFNLGPV